jgi:hypothetical protein
MSDDGSTPVSNSQGKNAQSSSDKILLGFTLATITTAGGLALLNIAYEKYAELIPDWVFILLCIIFASLSLSLALKNYRHIVYTRPVMSLISLIIWCGLIGVGVGTLIWWGIYKQPPKPEAKLVETNSPQSSPTQETPPLKQPRFREKTKEAAVFIGQGRINLKLEDLERQRIGLLSAYGAEIYVSAENGSLLLDCTLYDDKETSAVVITRNEFEVIHPSWDKNSSERALEIVNSEKQPVFQIIYESDTQIRIFGLFYGKTGAVVLDGNGMHPVLKKPTPYPFKPIFKYPSFKYPGEYAENK